MILAITITHIIVCLGLIAIVLLQAGKGAGLANIFGGGSSGLFTPSAGGPIAKVTAVLAVLFLITSLYLSLYTKTVRPSSIIEKALQQDQNQSNLGSGQEETSATQETTPQE